MQLWSGYLLQEHYDCSQSCIKYMYLKQQPKYKITTVKIFSTTVYETLDLIYQSTCASILAWSKKQKDQNKNNPAQSL